MRKKKGIQQKELAIEIGVSVPTISNWETGKCYPDIHSLLLLSSLFQVSLDELIKEKGYQNKVSILRYKSWNNDYQNDLRYLYVGDGMHLNSEGYAKLDSVIVDEIIKQLKYNNNEYQDD